MCVCLKIQLTSEGVDIEIKYIIVPVEAILHVDYSYQDFPLAGGVDDGLKSLRVLIRLVWWILQLSSNWLLGRLGRRCLIGDIFAIIPSGVKRSSFGHGRHVLR